ncbi:N-acetylmuramoyl-L-alanine amidase [Flagellimonas zhangzhouensis]|uniref:N-acetylmuramoyl-L-alanine amidase n=1 Tax=Flagellimonas zhangzhouensis TaxID=1073328 RepID=A0A1H2VLX8_9FLAO|nr:N-acetylmuramoyl-L-alanine amidase [Allomuricauda zhangzhouensis]SDQ06970.1 N-acetylmuramoyl-L-alanine amidase [Allomuricauda zhangzhouensis]SDW69312.1 N-acetylmuramoyl-L-alanine amidase [Allomuricauda zhangzhouensis]
MKFVLSLFLWVWACFSIAAQDDFYWVTAEQGDGIFSLLRKQGLDPAKHYKDFLELNTEGLKNGSDLKVGVAYKVPVSKDSFKKTGVLVESEENVEAPIFDKELGKMSLKSETLREAVYYLIAYAGEQGDESFVQDIAKSVAADLITNGAQVYIMDKIELDDASLSDTQKMNSFIETINKKYLQNSGKYQRVLIIRADNKVEKRNMNIAVYHHNKSEQGQRFADNIQNVFEQNSVSNISSTKADRVFKDKTSLYLARNILPAISLITLDDDAKTANEKISLKTDKQKLASLLSNGIMNDFVDLEIEN